MGLRLPLSSSGTRGCCAPSASTLLSTTKCSQGTWESRQGKKKLKEKAIGYLCMPMCPCLWVPPSTGSCQGFGKDHGEPRGQVTAPAAVSPSVPVPAASIVDAEPRVRATFALAAKHKPACATPGGEAGARKLKEKPGKGCASSGAISPKAALSQTASHGAQLPQQHLQFGAEIQQRGMSSAGESEEARR